MKAQLLMSNLHLSLHVYRFSDLKSRSDSSYMVHLHFMPWKPRMETNHPFALQPTPSHQAQNRPPFPPCMFLALCLKSKRFASPPTCGFGNLVTRQYTISTCLATRDKPSLINLSPVKYFIMLEMESAAVPEPLALVPQTSSSGICQSYQVCETRTQSPSYIRMYQFVD